MRDNAVAAGALDHDVLAAVHTDTRERDPPGFPQCGEQKGIGLFPRTIRHEIAGGLQEDRIYFRKDGPT